MQQIHVILISQNGSLTINFKKMLDVKDKQIAVLSIQYPDLQQPRRVKRVLKDSLVGDDPLTVFVHCNQISDSVHVNDMFSSNISLSMHCLDVIQLKSEQEYNVIEIQNPVYHDLNTDNLFSLNVELRDLNGELIKFTSRGYIVMKLALKHN